jgi:hypothetical protein
LSGNWCRNFFAGDWVLQEGSLSDGEYLAPDQSDQPFSEAILPKCSRRYGFVPDAHGRNAPDGIYDMNTAAEGARNLELLIDAALMAMAAYVPKRKMAL